MSHNINFPKKCTGYALNESEVKEFLLDEFCGANGYEFSDFDSIKHEIGKNKNAFYNSTDIIKVLKNNPKYSRSRLPNILRYCSSHFEFKETVFKRDFLKKIYDYRVVWENAESYKIVFYVTDDTYDIDLMYKINTEIFATDPSVKAVIVRATDYEDTYTVNDESELMLVSSVWFHVIQQDKTVWDVVAPVLQYFLNPELKLPVFNTGIRYVLQPVDKFKPGCPVPWREADINIEYAFREAVKTLKISDIVADYILVLGKEDVSSFLDTNKGFNRKYVEEIISKPESSDLKNIDLYPLSPGYKAIKNFIYYQPYGRILEIVEEGDGSFSLKKSVFKQFTSEFQCCENTVFNRNSLAKLWRKTWKKVSPPTKDTINLVWSTLIEYAEQEKRYITQKGFSDFYLKNFLSDLESCQYYTTKTGDTWILVKDNIIAWTVPAKLNVEGKFASAEFVKHETDVFGFVEDDRGNVYVFPQEESINYGYTSAGSFALICSLITLMENDLQSELKLPKNSSPLQKEIEEKVYCAPKEENLIIELDQLLIELEQLPSHKIKKFYSFFKKLI